MLDILFRLKRFLAQNQIVAGNIKVTVEFTDPETQARAEMLLRRNAYQDPTISPGMVDAICNEKPVQFLGGINIQVKRYNRPTRPPTPWHICDCYECRARADAMR